jgi:cysteine desulfurase
MSIYLDHSASTPVDPRVMEAMLPYFTEVYGNPSGVHRFAQQSEQAVEDAREVVAGVLGCKPREVVFTGCGSESDNLAIRGATLHAGHGHAQPHIITSAIEHPAVGNTALQLAHVNYAELEHVPLQADGSVTVDALESVLRDGTVLVTLMLANNEIGSISPIAELAEAAHRHGALFHTDAVQAAGQLPINVHDLNVDMLAISAHKFYGPKGVGALYVREGVRLLPSQTGGSHEDGRRAGTLNVPLIVGLAKALEIANVEREQHIAHMTRLRDRLISGILQNVPDVQLTGSAENRLPSHASFAFQQVDGNQLLMFLDNKGIAASAGSACKTGNPEPSEVLVALGLDSTWTLGGLRLTLGRHTTDEQIDTVLEILPAEVGRVRSFSRAAG